MTSPIRIGAMVDYFSAAFWLPELRSRQGLEQWVDRCRDLGISRLYFRVAIFGDFLHHTRLERRLSPALADSYQDPAKRQAFEDTCAAFAEFDPLAAVHLLISSPHMVASWVFLLVTLLIFGELGLRTGAGVLGPASDVYKNKSPS